jgi:two-component system KDP operon response regulator KdpE
MRSDAPNNDAPLLVGQPTATARVLIIDDEPEIRNAIRPGLQSAHFSVEWAGTATEGMDRLNRWHPDVIILDLSLPDMDGLQACRMIRQWSPVPIIVLSVRSSDADKITALESGADDYLTKPFSVGELIARLRVALRHAAHTGTGGDGTPRFQAGDLVIDFATRQVTMTGREIHLTPTEYEVLKYLAMNVGKVVTHQTLLQAVWGPAYTDEVHYLRVCVAQLRRKIEPDASRPHYLLTEPGVGYRLKSSQ